MADDGTCGASEQQMLHEVGASELIKSKDFTAGGHDLTGQTVFVQDQGVDMYDNDTVTNGHQDDDDDHGERKGESSYASSMVSSSSGEHPSHGGKQPRSGGGKQPRQPRHSGEKHPRPTPEGGKGLMRHPNGGKEPRGDKVGEEEGQAAPMEEEEDIPGSWEHSSSINGEELPRLEMDPCTPQEIPPLEQVPGNSAPSGEAATITTESPIVNHDTDKKETKVAKKIWGIIAKFANGKRLSGALEKDGTLKWKGGYRWKPVQASESGVLGEWIDAGQSKVTIGRKTITGPVGPFSWYPAEVIQLTGEVITRITARFANQKKLMGTIDAFDCTLMWTGGIRWTRKDGGDGGVYGRWNDEFGVEVQISQYEISGVGPRYPAKVLSITHQDGIPKKQSGGTKKKSRNKKLRKGELPPGIIKN
eukprot:940597-Amorphochlora_amoeboformis.AAC.1